MLVLRYQVLEQEASYCGNRLENGLFVNRYPLSALEGMWQGYEIKLACIINIGPIND